MLKLNIITNKSHLTPQEWLSLYIRKQVAIDCPEAEDLTWEESRPLAKPYKPQNDSETLEFNRLMAEWQNIQYAKMDADLVILSALEQCQKAHDLLIFFLCNNHDFDFIENYLKRHQNPLSKDPIKTLLDNSWIEIDRLSHLFFLESDDLGLLKDLWIVNKYSLNDNSYLDDQKKIADILISAGGFNDTAKDQLAKEIVDRIMPEGDSPRLYNFASLEAIEIGRRWARKNSINWSCNEAERKELAPYGNKTKERIILGRRIEEYAKEHNLDLRQHLLEMTVSQRTNDLAEAYRDLADYTIKAPFDGVVASVGVKPKEPASGSSVIATIITKQKIAEVSLNEVDAAKAAAGQKAMLTFDAVEDLEISGTVVEVDSIGTISQGVVSYNAKIAFDTQDQRIKPGMSVSATIITEIKQDVLIVSNSAIKTQNSQSYVEKFENEITDSNAYSQGVEATTDPVAIAIEVGISNDSYTEVVSGLSEGDQIILKKTSSTGTTKTSSGNSSAATPNIMQSLSGSSRMSGGMPPR